MMELDTIVCGDCLDVMPEIPNGSIDMVLADVPYGITACKWDLVIPLGPMWKQLKRVIKPNGAIVMTASQPFTSALVMSNVQMFKYRWVWDKGQGTGFLNAKKQPLRSCEDVLVFYAKQPTYNPQMRTGFKPYVCKQGATKTQNYRKQTGAITVSDGERFPLTLLKFIRDSSKVHPTQKPVALMEYLIKTYTNKGDTVLDFVIGSGTTAVAALKLGRHFYGCDINPEYVELANERVEKAKQEMAQLSFSV